MRLSCPNCLTEYDVPDAALAGRSRTLRCAHCNHQWVHGAAPVAPEPAPAPPPVETPVMAPVETPEPVAEAVQDAPAETMAALPPEPVATAPEWRPEMVVLPEPDLVPAHEYPEPDAPPAVEAAPAVTWPATPTLSGWPDFYARTPPEPEPLPEAEPAAPALPQGFGFPVDEAARDALNDAATAEAAVHDMNMTPVLPPPDAAAAIEPELEPAPEPAAPSLRLLTDEDFRLAAQPKPVEEEPDAFAALVTAARRKSLEYEPDPPPPPPPVRTSSTPLFILLLVLFILGMIGLERHLVIQLIPASAKIFQAIGLK